MDRLHAGIAQKDITPPVGYRMGGHFYEVVSEAIHDPLMAKAFVLDNGNERVAFAFCDLVGISAEAAEQVRQRYSDLGDIPVSNIMVAATHTHTGPLYHDIRGDLFHSHAVREYGDDPHETVSYPELLVERTVEALTAAKEGLRPARLNSQSASAPGVAFNRRYHMRDGSVRFNPGQLNPDIVEPAGPVDDELLSLLVTDIDRREALGGLSVFACHPDTIGGTMFSADYPFFIRQALRKKFGPDFVSAFALGAAGDVNHIDVSKGGKRKSIDISESIGGKLAALVGKERDRSRSEQTIGLASRTVKVPLQKVTAAEVDEAYSKLDLFTRRRKADFAEFVDAVKKTELAKRGESATAAIQAFRLGANTAMVGLPGEIFAELGLAIKHASPFEHTLVVSQANDRLGYIPTKKAFEEGSYEVFSSRVEPGAGELLADTAVDLLNELA